jgi:hypothetical protein
MNKVEGGLNKAGTAASQMASTMASDLDHATDSTEGTF